MNFFSGIGRAVVLMGVVFLNTTCNKRIFSKFTYFGYVYDSIGGKPVQGASVMLYACSKFAAGMSDCDQTFEYGTLITNKSGFFSFGSIHEAASDRYGIWLNGAPAYVAFNSLHTSQIDITHGSATKSELESGVYAKLYLK